MDLMINTFLHLLCKSTGGACIFVLCMEMITKSNCQHQLLPHDLLLSAIWFDSTFAGFILGRCSIFFFVASVLMCHCIPCRAMENSSCTLVRTDIDTCAQTCTKTCVKCMFVLGVRLYGLCVRFQGLGLSVQGVRFMVLNYGLGLKG